MTYGVIYGVYAVIIVLAIGATSGIKLIAKKIHGGSLSNAYEYILSISSFLLAAGGNLIWLCVGCGFTSTAYLSVMCSLAGSSTYIVYLLIFQSTRKLGISIIQSIVSKMSASEIADSIAETVKDGDNTSEETAEAVTEAITPDDDTIKSVINYLKNKRAENE